jgi:outer membrane lipoprotein LolB
MKRLTVIWLAGLGLTGCVSMKTPPQQPAGSFQTETAAQRQTQLETVRSWNASGAISIQRASQSPVIMRYDWQQEGPDHYQIHLAASLNLGAVSITGRPGRVTLQKGNEPPISAATPEALMQKGLGWSLPIPAFWYWARGLPAPGATQATTYDSYGHLTVLQQQGWTVRFSDYHTIQGVDLPQVIQLQRPGIFIKIVIKQWSIHPAT